MNVSIIGCGYVGLVTGALLAELGHNVVCYDCGEDKIEQLAKGKILIYEKGLQALISKHLQNETIRFTTDPQVAVNGLDAVFITVGTPAAIDGKPDETYLQQVEQQIIQYTKQSTVFVVKSTVLVGYNDRLQQKLTANVPSGVEIQVVSNPEFLREGQALLDAFQPDRIIIGADNEQATGLVANLYKSLNAPTLITSRASAEMIKYASNAFLALKISYINQISNLCKRVNASIEEVANGIGLDQRIGRSYLNAGIGYGGSCFPKDTLALVQLANEHGTNLSIIEEVIKANEEQRSLFVKEVTATLNHTVIGKRIALLGLAFKPNTNDIRESPSIYVATELQQLGAHVVVYDPLVQSIPLSVEVAGSFQACVQDAAAILVMVASEEVVNAYWTEIKALAPKAKVLVASDFIKLNRLHYA